MSTSRSNPRKLTACALTDVGRRRDHNEDAWTDDEGLGVYVVCDGMGGHASGEVASRLTCDHIVDFVRRHREAVEDDLPYKAPGATTPAEALLSNAIQHANDRVYVEGMKDPKLEGMGTTVVAVMSQPDRLVMAHVGDSRVYRWCEEDGLEQVTRDHSLLNHKIDTGELRTDEEIQAFTQGNIIVRAVGLKDYVVPEVQTVDRRPEDLFLLCSDGLTDMVEDWLIQNVVEANVDDLEEASRALVRMANDRGGKDNVTVMLIRVDDRPAGVEQTDPAGVSIFHDEDTQPSGVRAMEDTEPTIPRVSREAPPADARGRDDHADPDAAPLEPVEDDDGPVDLEEWARDSPGRSRKGTPFLGHEVCTRPTERRVKVRSGTTSVAERDRKRRAARRATRPDTDDGPSVIVEEPSVIIDDGYE
ncbi:MAG: Stp1/IreP family PP2C-type Ser/Thr phosphatase [Myxococcota bacterium]